MLCQKCQGNMQYGKAFFSKCGASLTDVLFGTKVEFTVNNYTIDQRSVTCQNGWYCGKCGIFTLEFDVRKQNNAMPLYENGLDSDFNEEIDDIPDKICPHCSASIDIDYPRCPECGCVFDQND